jgi:hypothetical protein
MLSPKRQRGYFNSIISAQIGYYQKQEIIDVLILCVRQNIAIGEHTDSKNNFMAILRHVFKHDEILLSRLDNPVPNSRIKYISPDIQKDIIGISAKWYVKKLLERVMILKTLF